MQRDSMVYMHTYMHATYIRTDARPCVRTCVRTDGRHRVCNNSGGSLCDKVRSLRTSPRPFPARQLFEGCTTLHKGLRERSVTKHPHTCVHTYKCQCILIYYTCIRMRVCVYIYIHIYFMCMHIYIHICSCVFAHIQLHVYTCMHPAAGLLTGFS